MRVRFGYATEDSKRAKQTHFGLTDTAQIHVLIGFAGKIALFDAARNSQYMKIIAGHD
jgi:hypothetical protein